MYERIPIPIDGSPTPNQGLDEALSFAKLTGAQVRLPHVVDVMSHADGFETHTACTDHLLPAIRAYGMQILSHAAGAGS